MNDGLDESALREVFNVCDDDNDGYISIERFIQVAKENFTQWDNNEEAIIKITTLLSRGHDSQINFENFCSGIERILDLQDGCTDTKARVSNEDDVDSGAWSSKSQETPKLDCLASLDEFLYEDDPGTPQQNMNSTPYHHSSQLNFSAPQSRSGSFRRNLAPYSSTHSGRSLGNTYLQNLSRRSSLSEGMMDDIDSHYNHLSEKVSKLEEQLEMMSECQKLDGQIRSKLKDENSSYIHRIHLLEEQLREVELTSEERFEEERKKREEFLTKSEKDKSGHIEVLTESLKLIEKEHKNLLEEVPFLRSENEKLKKTNSRLLLEYKEVESNLSRLELEKENMETILQSEMIQISDERKVHSQLVDELSEELKDLRKRQKSDSRLESPQDVRLPRTVRREVELQMNNLREENITLREKLDDLQGQLLQRQLADGFQLIGDRRSTSLAEEMGAKPKEELLRMMICERERSRKLAEYIDDVLLRILESNPNLLEIPNKR